MLEYLNELLEDLKEFNFDGGAIAYFTNYHQKIFALETAIDILEKMKN